jgi:hypothetical protein
LDEFIAEHPEVNVIKILEDDDKDAVELNNIQSFPTFIVLRGNDPLKSIPGLHDKEQLEELFA